MPNPGKRWFHVTVGTHSSWLPGDPCGFRSRDHKIHSSGDHKNPPPKCEHAGLHDFSQSISGKPVILPSELRETICGRFIDRLHKRDHRLLVVSVSGMHVHMLAELPNGRERARHEVGIAKKAATQAISHIVAGQIWAKGCGLKPVRDEDHHRNTFGYIQRHTDEGAFVWTFRDENKDG